MENFATAIIFVFLFAMIFLELLTTYLPIFWLGVCYAFCGTGLMTMAKMRGLERGWLAFVPICDSYSLGKIADDISLRSSGKKTKYRIALPILQYSSLGILFLALAVTMVAFFCLILSIPMEGGDVSTVSAATPEMGLFSMDIVMLIWVVAVGILALSFPISIAGTIVLYVALFRLFRDYSPEHYIVHFLLAFFLGTGPISLFLLREKPPMSIVNPGYYRS